MYKACRKLNTENKDNYKVGQVNKQRILKR